MTIILVIYTHLNIWGWLSQFHLDCNITLTSFYAMDKGLILSY